MLHGGGIVRQKFWWCVFLIGCEPKPVELEVINPDPVTVAPPGGDDGGGDDDDGDDDGSSDADGTDTAEVDGDGDDDDADADADGGPGLDCSQDVEQTPVDDCVTRPLMCDTGPIISTTKRASNRFESLDYNAHYCFPDSDPKYDGPDTVFIFEHPGTGNVDIQLHAPCGELDLIALRWQDWTDDGTCPTADTLSVPCEDSTDDGDDTVMLYETEPKDYLIIVDGPDGERANFTLYADCP